MVKYGLDKQDVDFIFKKTKSILKYKGITEEKEGVLKFRNHIGKLMNLSGDTLYNQIINNPQPYISEKALNALEVSVVHFFRNAGKFEYEGFSKPQFDKFYSKVTTQKITVSKPPNKRSGISSNRIKTQKNFFENTSWYVFFYDSITGYENDNPTLYHGISWAFLKCLSSGKAELTKQKSPNENQSSSIYTGVYTLSKDSRELMFALKLNGDRDLRINIYVGNGSDYDYCVGMATNSTEEFEAWAVLFVQANKIEYLNLQPGFQTEKLIDKSEKKLPDFVCDFFKSPGSSYLSVPKIGTGINNIYRIINNRKHR
jgi:hypothetical protein